MFMRIPLAIQATSALSAGIFITFSQVHDASTAVIGLLVLSVGWLAGSILSAVKSYRAQGFVLHTVIAVAAALMAVLTLVFNGMAQPILIWVLIAHWGFYDALTQAIFARRAQAKSAARRDHAISAGLGLLLYISQLTILLLGNDPVSQVGFFGAYAIILGVHQGITAASPKA